MYLFKWFSDFVQGVLITHSDLPFPFTTALLHFMASCNIGSFEQLIDQGSAIFTIIYSFWIVDLIPLQLRWRNNFRLLRWLSVYIDITQCHRTKSQFHLPCRYTHADMCQENSNANRFDESALPAMLRLRKRNWSPVQAYIIRNGILATAGDTNLGFNKGRQKQWIPGSWVCISLRPMPYHTRHPAVHACWATIACLPCTCASNK